MRNDINGIMDSQRNFSVKLNGITGDTVLIKNKYFKLCKQGILTYIVSFCNGDY